MSVQALEWVLIYGKLVRTSFNKKKKKEKKGESEGVMVDQRRPFSAPLVMQINRGFQIISRNLDCLFN